MLNCVLRGTLVNQIFEEQNVVKLCSLNLPILQTIRVLSFCFVCRKKIAISANLFTAKHKLKLNCVLHGTFVNKILENHKVVKF
jgi:hypothetical protein